MLVVSLLMNNYLLQTDKGFVESFTGTFILAIFIIFILVSVHFRELKKLGVKEFTDENLAVRQEKIITSKFNNEEVLQKLKQEEYFKNFNFGREGEGNLAVIKTFPNTFSSGEVIKVDKIGDDNNLYKYKISSTPKSKLTLLDNGISYANIMKLEAILKL